MTAVRRLRGVGKRDLCDSANLKYLDDRLGRKRVRHKLIIGNPTFDGLGINAIYEASDQKEWFIQCPHRHQRQTLNYYENAVRQVKQGD